MAVLVIADHDNAALSDATAKTVTAAKTFGGDVDVLVAGKGAGDVAAAAAAIDGVRKVIHADGDAYEKQLAEAMEALIVPMMDGMTPCSRQRPRWVKRHPAYRCEA